MPNRAFFIALLLSSAALPVACSGESTTTNGAGGTAGNGGRAGTGAQSGGGGKGGTGTGGTTSTGGASQDAGRGGRTMGFGAGGSAGSSFGRPGTGGAFGGMSGAGNAASGGTGDTTGSAGQPGDGEDLGVAERRPYCLAVCAYGPTPSSRLASADAGAAGTTEAGGAPGAGASTATGGTPGFGGEAGAPFTAGAGGAGESAPCGHASDCVASLCPTQHSESCGDLLTTFVKCMANADPDLVASLVTSCTEAQGPSLDTLIYQACYGQYADWTRGCL